jgi:hypothetical protein
MKSLRFPLIGVVLLLEAYLSRNVSPFEARPSESLLAVCYPAAKDRIDVEALLAVCCPAARDRIDVEIPPDRGFAAY